MPETREPASLTYDQVLAYREALADLSKALEIKPMCSQAAINARRAALAACSQAARPVVREVTEWNDPTTFEWYGLSGDHNLAPEDQ